MYGFDTMTGDMYGYSTADDVYIMQAQANGRLYSVPVEFHKKIRQKGLLYEHKVIVAECSKTNQVDERRDDSLFPLDQSKIKTQDGVILACDFLCFFFYLSLILILFWLAIMYTVINFQETGYISSLLVY